MLMSLEMEHLLRVTFFRQGQAVRSSWAVAPRFVLRRGGFL
jgi:hypothetical protein